MDLEISDKLHRLGPVGPNYYHGFTLDPHIICISLYYTNMYIYNDFLSIDRK